MGKEFEQSKPEEEEESTESPESKKKKREREALEPLYEAVKEKYGNVDFLDEPRKEVNPMNGLVEKDPGAALRLYSYLNEADISNEPDYEKLLEKAARNAAKKDPVAALRYAHLYDGRSYDGEVRKKAGRNAAEKDPMAAIKYEYIYADQDYSLKIRKKAIKNAEKILAELKRKKDRRG